MLPGHKSRCTLEAPRGHADFHKQPSYRRWGPLLATPLTLHCCTGFLTAVKIPIAQAQSSQIPPGGAPASTTGPDPPCRPLARYSGEVATVTMATTDLCPPFPTSMPCGQPLKYCLEGGGERGLEGRIQGSRGTGVSQNCVEVWMSPQESKRAGRSDLAVTGPGDAHKL